MKCFYFKGEKEEREKEIKKVEEKGMKEREGRKEGKKIGVGGDKEKEKKRKGKRKESRKTSGNSA